MSENLTTQDGPASPQPRPRQKPDGILLSHTNLTRLQVLLTVGLPAVSIVLAVFKFLPNYTGHMRQPEQAGQAHLDLFYLMLTGVIFPVVSNMIAYSINRFQLDKVRGGLEELKSSFEATNLRFRTTVDEEIKKLKGEALNAVKPTADMSRLMNHEHSRILTHFIPDILDDLEIKLRELSNGHLYENDPDKYHSFAVHLFSLADKEIIATSTVDPDEFWEGAAALEYLHDNAKLIKDNNLSFTRYFFVNKENFEKSKTPVADNISIGAKVCIIEDEDLKDKKHKKDGGLIDDSIYIVSTLDSTGKNIQKVNAYVGVKHELKGARAWVNYLERISKPVEKVYKEYGSDPQTQAEWVLKHSTAGPRRPEGQPAAADNGRAVEGAPTDVSTPTVEGAPQLSDGGAPQP